MVKWLVSYLTKLVSYLTKRTQSVCIDVVKSGFLRSSMWRASSFNSFTEIIVDIYIYVYINDLCNVSTILKMYTVRR